MSTFTVRESLSNKKSNELLLLLTEPDTIRLDCGLKLQQNT